MCERGYEEGLDRYMIVIRLLTPLSGHSLYFFSHNEKIDTKNEAKKLLTWDKGPLAIFKRILHVVESVLQIVS